MKEENKIGHPNLHPAINAALQLQEEKGGIFVDKIKGDIKIKIKTKSGSNYTLYKENDKYFLQGGKHLSEKEEVTFNGSTWGGSMLRMMYIGYNMHVECIIKRTSKMLLTSSVQSAEIIGKDYSYKMEW